MAQTYAYTIKHTVTHYASNSRLNIMDTKVEHCTITGVHRTGVKAGGKGRFRKIPRFNQNIIVFQCFFQLFNPEGGGGTGVLCSYLI